MKKASQTVMSHLVSKVMQSENATNSKEDQVFKVAEKWMCLNQAWETSDEELQRMLGQFCEIAASTLHLYLLCSAIQAQVGIFFTSVYNIFLNKSTKILCVTITITEIA